MSLSHKEKQICSLFQGISYIGVATNDTTTVLTIDEPEKIISLVYERLYVLLSTVPYINVYRNNNRITIVDVRGEDHSWILQVLNRCR